MINIKNLVYILTCLSLSIIIGAAVFEHLAVWPRTYAAPPASLSMLQGEYGLNSVAFWAKIHPITLVLFITTLFIFWKNKRRKNVLIPLIGYLMVMVATSLYFVPELMDITGTAFATTIDESLQRRGQIWINLSLLRLLIIMVLAIILYLGLTKTDLKIQ